MNVREYAAALLALPPDSLDLQVVSYRRRSYEFVGDPEVYSLSEEESEDLAMFSVLSPDDVQRVVVVS